MIDDDPALRERVRDRDYRAQIERVIRIHVMAWDLNCRQHFPKLVRAESLRTPIDDREERPATACCAKHR